MTTKDEFARPPAVDVIEYARQRYCMRSSDDIEIDDRPKISRAEQGAWVRAWVWVPYADLEKGA